MSASALSLTNRIRLSAKDEDKRIEEGACGLEATSQDQRVFIEVQAMAKCALTLLKMNDRAATKVEMVVKLLTVADRLKIRKKMLRMDSVSRIPRAPSKWDQRPYKRMMMRQTASITPSSLRTAEPMSSKLALSAFRSR